MLCRAFLYLSQRSRDDTMSIVSGGLCLATQSMTCSAARRVPFTSNSEQWLVSDNACWDEDCWESWRRQYVPWQWQCLSTSTYQAGCPRPEDALSHSALGGLQHRSIGILTPALQSSVATMRYVSPRALLPRLLQSELVLLPSFTKHLAGFAPRKHGRKGGCIPPCKSYRPPLVLPTILPCIPLPPVIDERRSGVFFVHSLAPIICLS